MRLAPAVIFNRDYIVQARHDARLSTITTHGSELCIQASEVFACLLWLALDGKCSKTEALNAMSVMLLEEYFRPEIAAIVDGSFIHKKPPEIRGTGYVVESADTLLLKATTADVTSIAEFCELQVITPSLENLGHYLNETECVWCITDYSFNTEKWFAQRYELTGLIETAAAFTAYSRGDRFMDGFWEGEIEDGLMQKFFNSAGNRFSAFARFLETSHVLVHHSFCNLV